MRERREPDRGPFLPLGTLRTRAATWVGIALAFAWVDLLFCFEGVLRDQEVMQGGLVHDPVFLGATVVASLALAASSALCRARARQPQDALQRALFGNRAVPACLCLLGALCAGAATLLTDLAPTAPRALHLAAGMGAGPCIAWLTLSWGRTLSRLDLRETLLLVSAAACTQWLPFIPLAWLPTPVRVALMVTLPLVAGWLSLRAGADEAGTEVAAQAEGRGTGRRAAGTPAPEADGTRTLGRLTLAMAVFSFVIQFVWCYFIKMLPGRLDVGLFPGVFAVAAAGSALIVGLCARTMSRCGSYRLELYYRATFALCLCGVAATGVAATSASMAELFASYALVYAGYSMVAPTMWMLALGYASMRRTSPTRVLGSVFAGQYLGLFGGFAAVEVLVRLADAPEVQGQEAMPAVVLALVAVLALAYTALFPERNLLSLSPLLFGMSHESVARRCEALAREHGLTPRETEVLTLLARGRDVGYICDELCIARNTVNAHRKSVYAKLGVHSQQELLTAVEEAQG